MPLDVLVVSPPLSHVVTPPWCEQVPERCSEKLYVPSRQTAVAPTGGDAATVVPLPTPGAEAVPPRGAPATHTSATSAIASADLMAEPRPPRSGGRRRHRVYDRTRTRAATFGESAGPGHLGPSLRRSHGARARASGMECEPTGVLGCSRLSGPRRDTSACGVAPGCGGPPIGRRGRVRTRRHPQRAPSRPRQRSAAESGGLKDQA